MKRISCYLFLILSSSALFSQNKKFTQQDTLRGSITNERIWWDLLHYDLEVKVDAENKFISGSNTIQYKVIKEETILQIDLQNPMKIVKIKQEDKNLQYQKTGSAYFITLLKTQKIGDTNQITIFFEGKPKEAIKPPWDGGIVWKKINTKTDTLGKTKMYPNFIANANQGIGASIWWPCKDHPYDEPNNGITIKVTPPKGFMDVSNGVLKKITPNLDGSNTYEWEVKNPINSYAININIANYSHFSEVYKGEKGNLQCNYYVLPEHLEKAKIQFQQTTRMLEAFEYWFGPYPFYEDGYKLVEAPYLGMEHQSSITYGNGFENGYLGKDLSGTGWGFRFDFILVHESGHEWFANNITNKDVADMWIHESFTTYSEVLYLDYHFGTKAGNEYLIGYRKKVKNDRPMIGTYHVNNRGSNDIYIKGASMIHTLRQVVNNDVIFRNLLRDMNLEFYHQTVSSNQIEKYISAYLKLDLDGFFKQYLTTTQIPTIAYKIKKRKIKYRFTNTVKNFNIPVKVIIDTDEKWINPSSKKWKTIKKTKPNTTFTIEPNFYINSEKIN